MEELIYRISFEGLDEQAKAIGQLDNEVAALNQTIKAQRESAKILSATNQEGTKIYEDLQQAIGENIVKSRELTKQKSDLIRQTQNEAKSNDKAEGSIDALRAQLALLTKQYNALGKEQRQTGEGKEIQTQAKAISDELKSLESVIGDNRRNVGNYTEALEPLRLQLRQITEAAQSLEVGTPEFEAAAKKAAELKEQIDDTNEAIQESKGTAFEKFNNQLKGIGESLLNLDTEKANQQIGRFGETLKGISFSSVTSGIKDFGNTLLNFGKTLLANPLFLFASVIAGIGAALFALKDRVKIIGDAFEGLKSIVTSFTDAIGLTSVAETKRGEEARAQSAKNVAAYQAERDAFIQASRERQAQLQNEIKGLREFGGSVNDIILAELKLLQSRRDEIGKQIEQAQVNRDAIQIIADATGKGSEALNKYNAEIADLTAKDRELGLQQDALNRTFGQLDTSLDGLNFQLQVYNEQLSTIDVSTEAGRKQFNALQKEIDRLQKKIESITDPAEKGSILSLQRQLTDLQEIFARESDLQILNKLQKEIDNVEKRIKEVQTLAKADLSLTEDLNEPVPFTSEQLNEINAKAIKEIDDAKNQAENAKKKAEEEARKEAEELKQAREQGAQSLLELTSNTIGQLAELRAQDTADVIANLEAQRAAQIKNVEESTKSEAAKAKEIAGINETFNRQILAEQKKAAEQQKKITLFQIAVDTAKGISAAVSAGAGLIFPANIPAIAAGISAVLAGIFQANQAIKAADKFEKGGKVPFNTGGVIQGASHANGGVPFVAGGQLMEAEGGELIVNKNIWSRPDFVNAISAMNAATGGVRFAAGGIVPKFTPSGQSITTEALASSGSVQDLIPLLNNLQVTNNVVDTSSNQSTLINITNNATIG